MKVFSKIATVVLLSLSVFQVASVQAFSLSDIFQQTGSNESLDIKGDKKAGTDKGEVSSNLDHFAGSTGVGFFSGGQTGEKGAYNLILQIAKSVKDLFMLIAVIFLVIGVLKIIFGKGGEDDAKKWKTSIVWTTLGIVVMQIAFVFVLTLFDKNINGSLADTFLDKILYPFVHLVETLASFVFLAMAFIAFFRLVTAGGNEDGAKKGKQGIIYALIGFLLLKIPAVFVSSIYGDVQCDNRLILKICKVSDPNLSKSLSIMTSLVNYLNGFLALGIVLLIIYSGFLIITGGGDEEKMKKVKKTLLYIAIGMLLLVSSYALFNFYLQKG